MLMELLPLHDAGSRDPVNAKSDSTAEGDMIGSCDAMLALFRAIRKVSRDRCATVFISGESGTGKELTATAIHARSARRDEPFVAINCGAIPPHLLQSELFGYERGAFTGANQRKIGRVEAANGGTLFLDEIGDLPLESQASLLRFLQERKIERLGGHESTPVDVRIVSATHVDMQTAMVEGRFRADLYHRLCVLQIEEPPLRARGKDIELLARHMLDRPSEKDDAKAGVSAVGFAPDAIAAIHNYGWPGNVRELINRVRRAIVMAEGRLIGAHDLELGEFAECVPMSLAQAREGGERQAIEMALLRNRGRVGRRGARTRCVPGDPVPDPVRLPHAGCRRHRRVSTWTSSCCGGNAAGKVVPPAFRAARPAQPARTDMGRNASCLARRPPLFFARLVRLLQTFALQEIEVHPLIRLRHRLQKNSFRGNHVLQSGEPRGCRAHADAIQLPGQAAQSPG